MQQKEVSKGLGIAGMILGIIGLFFAWWPIVGAIMPVLALIFGLVQKSKGPDGYSTAAVVLGAIGLSIQILMWFLIGAMIGAGF